MVRFSPLDPNSYARPEYVVTRHADITWNVDFDTKTLVGEVVWHFDIIAKEIEHIHLDISELTIEDVSLRLEGGSTPVNHFISDFVENIGSKLVIELPTKTSGEVIVAIKYRTAPTASGLQWLLPENTYGKKYPYLFSQCQAIHARSLIPCQDSAAVKFTFRAEVTHPSHLTALMGGVRLGTANGRTTYEQTVKVPAYLLAIAVGDVVSRQLGPNSKVWAEEGVVQAAAEEFSDTPRMLQIAEEICGPYVWKDYDLLVMPPSFPFGGMENPCLTFVTPTLLAGDKSGATVVAHEISHSWTGNLVTNANWEHFWLNEGFTMFLEGKICGRMFGDAARDFHALQGITELKDNLNTQLSKTPELTKLVVDLTDCNPDDTYSAVPYMKGQNFLRYIEDTLGGPSVFEPFFRFYLQKYAYKSVVSDEFKATLYEYFSGKADEQLAKIDWDLWLYGEGMPPIIPNYDQSIKKAVLEQVHIWATKTVVQIKQSPDLASNLSVLQKIEILKELVQVENILELSDEWLSLLEATYGFKGTKNAAILFRLARLAIKGRHLERLPQVFEFANSNFRMKYVRPIYRDLNFWSEARPLAIENFQKVRSFMMKCCEQSVAKDLDLNE